MPTRRAFLAGSLALAAAPILLADPPNDEPQPIPLDSKKQLFLDDHIIASLKNVRRTIDPATKHSANPMIWPSEKWEDPMNTIYGSVLLDHGQYRMWYKSGIGCAYAQSDDGIHWTKPALDFVEIDGQKTNLLWKKKSKKEPPDDFPYYYELFGVHRDDAETDPQRRYKMGFLDIDWEHKGEGGDPFHAGQRRGWGAPPGPDGLHWKLLDNFATEAIRDGATHWMFDPARKLYVLYGRTRKEVPQLKAAWSKYDWFRNWYSARAVARLESRDFLHWDYTKPDTAPVVLTPDENDPPITEIYSIKVFPYEGVYIGLVQVFHATPDQASLDVQLAVSRDGVHFTRVGDRSPFIPLGPVGSWDRFNHSLANNDPIAVGDELRIYYGGRSYRHDPYKGTDTGPNRAGIGLATILRDRFVALESSFDGGQILTKPLLLKSANLHLNANALFGQITIDLVDSSGQLIGKSKPVKDDKLDIGVAWETAPDQLEKPTSLRIHLKNARLFALWSA